MPLRRAADRFIYRRGIVHFLMKDGGDEVICAISPRVLVEIGEQVGLRNAIYVFWAFRDEIERAASAKYDGAARVPYEIVEIQTQDLKLSRSAPLCVR
jgi:Protein of unknown function (DUF1488)